MQEEQSIKHYHLYYHSNTWQLFTSLYSSYIGCFLKRTIVRRENKNFLKGKGCLYYTNLNKLFLYFWKQILYFCCLVVVCSYLKRCSKFGLSDPIALLWSPFFARNSHICMIISLFCKYFIILPQVITSNYTVIVTERQKFGNTCEVCSVTWFSRFKTSHNIFMM